MSDYLENIMMVLMEMVCFVLFLDAFASPKYAVRRLVLQTLALTGAASATVLVLGTHFFEKQFVVLAVLFLFARRAFCLSRKKAVLLTVLFYALLLVVDCAVYIAHNRIFAETSAPFAEVMLALIGKIVLLFLVLLVRHCFGDRAETETDWLRFLPLPLFTVWMIALLMQTFGYTADLRQQGLLRIFAVGLAVMNFYAYAMLRTALQKDADLREQKLLQETARLQLERYENQRSLMHDHKNQMQYLLHLMEQHDYEAARSHIEKQCGAVAQCVTLIDTNHPVVNAVLNMKYAEAEKKGIHVTVMINDLSRLSVHSDDLVSILANLLDNAIEACMSCPEKWIWFKFVQDNGKTVLSVRNTESAPAVRKNGSFLTSKTADKNRHGIGIRTVEKIARRYGAHCHIEEFDGSFLFTVVWES